MERWRWSYVELSRVQEKKTHWIKWMVGWGRRIGKKLDRKRRMDGWKWNNRKEQMKEEESKKQRI